jgi:myo-inositol-1-phosphate synthase
MNDYPNSQSFRVADVKPVNVVEELKNSGAEALICYLPVGSQKAVEFYANACLQAKVGMVNCMPVFIASNKEWANKFKEAGVPIIGDDIKSQVGATIVHRVISRLFNDRGCKILRTYQLNTGGNTDFLNMLEKSRLKSKKFSKTESVQSQLDVPLDAKNIHIGPSDYVPWQKDNKIAFIRIEGEGFGGAPIELEMRLSVQDSPNSAGVVIDAIRCVALARERGLAGPINSVSSYYMKTPPEQYRDSIALELTNDFIKGKISEADNRIIVTEETIKQKKPTIHRLQTLN